MSISKDEGPAVTSEHPSNPPEKPNEDGKSESSSNYQEEAFIISGIILFIILTITYSYYKTLDMFLISACIGISMLFGEIAKFILHKNKIILKYLNSEIKMKYLYLFIVSFICIIIMIYIYTPIHYGMVGEKGKIEYKYYDEPTMKLDINKMHIEKLKAIFPELAEIRPWCGFLTYTTNGHLTLDFPNGTLDDMENYIRLGFQYDDADCESNSGLIIGPLGCYDATKFQSGGLSFWVKGKKGGERFGIGIKDVDGHEFKVNAERYLDQNRTTVNWQPIFIPLSDFKHVTLSRLDVISLYSNGKMHSGGEYQIIYVANFGFKKFKFY